MTKRQITTAYAIATSMNVSTSADFRHLNGSVRESQEILSRRVQRGGLERPHAGKKGGGAAQPVPNQTSSCQH